jgi:hypothetical protein
MLLAFVLLAVARHRHCPDTITTGDDAWMSYNSPTLGVAFSYPTLWRLEENVRRDRWPSLKCRVRTVTVSSPFDSEVSIRKLSSAETVSYGNQATFPFWIGTTRRVAIFDVGGVDAWPKITATATTTEATYEIRLLFRNSTETELRAAFRDHTVVGANEEILRSMRFLSR